LHSNDSIAANGNTQHFEAETAKAICARCLVKAGSRKTIDPERLMGIC